MLTDALAVDMASSDVGASGVRKLNAGTDPIGIVERSPHNRSEGHPGAGTATAANVLGSAGYLLVECFLRGRAGCDRHPERHRERIAGIRRRQPAIPHVVFALELDPLAAVAVAVFRRRQIIEELGIQMVDATALTEPVPHLPPHLGAAIEELAFLQRLHARVAAFNRIPKALQNVGDTSADTNLVHHEAIWQLLVEPFGNARRQLHGIELAPFRDSQRGLALPDHQHALISAFARDVERHDLRSQRIVVELPAVECAGPLELDRLAERIAEPRLEQHLAVLDEVGSDELRVGCPGEFTPHAHPDEIAVLAVVVDPFLELRLVGLLRIPAVDAIHVPAMPEPTKAFSEASGILGRVA